MGIVVDSALYATPADLHAFGVPESIDDELLQDALEVAVENITAYTGTVFGTVGSSTYVVNDIRKRLVVLPTPFANVTASASTESPGLSGDCLKRSAQRAAGL